MGRKSRTRTGIDFGTTSVKIVHAVGTDRLEKITHLGSKAWDRDDADSAAESVKALMKELGLGKKQLGLVAVSIGGEDTTVREVSVPSMSHDQFRQSIPFEARKYMQLQDNDAIVSDGQILLENDETTEDEATEMKAIIAATSQSERAQVLSILSRVGIEPQVIDTEPTASLNALMGARHVDDDVPDSEAPAIALLDLGGRRASLYISSNKSGFMNRTIWEGDPPTGDENAEKDFIRTIATRALETLTFYRGRFRREVTEIRLMGGGALKKGRTQALSAALNRDVQIFDPLEELAADATGREEVRGSEPTFVTSCGLCRWGDDDV